MDVSAQVVDEKAPMDTNPDWFPNVRLNWTENVKLCHSPILVLF